MNRSLATTERLVRHRVAIRQFKPCHGQATDIQSRRISPFTRTALVLQGGGALGAYQAGVYEVLSDAGYEPHWIAGISIGGINAAIIVGNKPEDRLPRLKDFWH